MVNEISSREEYDILVVGGGHAGLEASVVAARMGFRVHLLTMLVENIALASCNPAIGGLGKGHLVKEIDALGGVMGEITDSCGIQYRILNASKGPAVRGTRAQIDMDDYKIHAKNLALRTPNLSVSQELVTALLTERLFESKSKAKHKILGVKTHINKIYYAKRVILTTGTFLRGLVHIGENQSQNGRFGESASFLSQSLEELGFKLGRLKTGTCPRLDAKSIDFSQLEEHLGDFPPPKFSYKTKDFSPTQLPCYVAYTNSNTHEIIRKNFSRTPLFTGQIEGVGPRYCPSIEDKVYRFFEKERHQLFLEPQTRACTEYYVNGLSTSLPFDVQEEIVHSICGLEHAHITRYGYAIEYDYVNPTALYHTLQTQLVEGLYFAGQINGTTGYEEAAAQGLMAGINASLSLRRVSNPRPLNFSEDRSADKDFKGNFLERGSLVLRRDESYIGVMIDDLVSKGTNEPYRVFTSRAEYRLLLREDNALFRLADYSYYLGLMDEEQYRKISKDSRDISYCMEILRNHYFTPSRDFIAFLHSIEEEKINDKTQSLLVVGRDSFGLEKFDYLDFMLGLQSQKIFSMLSLSAREQIKILCKYDAYIQKQEQNIKVTKEMLGLEIPMDLRFEGISGLSLEVIEKLNKFRPKTLFDASRISGITPASLDILHLHIHLYQRNTSKNHRKQMGE